MSNELSAATRVRALLGGASRYFGFNVLNAAIPFLFLPVLSRYLTPADYGTAGIFLVLVGIALPIVGMNIHAAVGVRYAQRESLDLPAFVSTSLLLVVGLGAVASVLVALLAGPIAFAAAFPAGWLWAVVAVCVGQAVFNVVCTLLQMQRRPTSYGLYQTAMAASFLLASLWLVVGLGWDWRGRVVAQLGATLLLAIVGLGLLMHDGLLAPRVQRGYISQVLRFGAPLIPHVLGGYAYTMLDRMFVAHMVGMHEAGIYFAGFQLAQIVTVVETSFNQAWTPWAYAELARKDPRADRRIVQGTYAYFAGMLAFAGVFGVVVPLVLPLYLGARYAAASSVVPWLAFAFALGGMYKMVCTYLFYRERTSVLATVTLVVALASPAFTYGLIRWHGVVGAAQATLVSFLLQFVLTWVAAQRVHPMPWRLRAPRLDAQAP